MIISPTRIFASRKISIFFFIALIAGCNEGLHAQEYFVAVKKAEKNEQYKIARKIYYEQINDRDSITCVTALAQLETLANKEKNKELKVVFLALMGDFYVKINKAAIALDYLNKALPRAIEYKLKDLQAEIYANMGWSYYYGHHDYNQGFEYMLKANNLVESGIGYRNFLSSNRLLYNLGFMYYDFGNNTKARNYLFESLNYPFDNQLYAVKIYNTLALTYRSENMNDSAAVYFIKAAAIAEANNYGAWIGITKGNLGLIYYNMNRLEEAKPLLQTDMTLSIANNEWGSAANTLCLYANMSIKENNLSKAAGELDSVLLFYHRQKSIATLYQYYTLKAILSKKQRDYISAVGYLDSAKILQDSIIKKNNSQVYARTEEKIQMEKYLAEKKLMEIENNRLVLLRNFIIILLILVLVITIQFIFRMQAKRKKEQTLMAVAKDQLAYYVENLRSKTEMIDEFQKEIERLNTLPGYMLQKEKDEMAANLKHYTILTETHWNEFRHLFEKVHTGFFEKLKIRYSNLTQAEIRLLALLRLNLSKKEMAEMLGVSPETVKKTRQRIHHKIELPENKQLEDIVLTI
jgi:DNA-binding CsgD family transcriptional regulator